jgi:hypothetical protein
MMEVPANKFENDKQTFVQNRTLGMWLKHILREFTVSINRKVRRADQSSKGVLPATALSSQPMLRLLISAVLGSTTVGGIRL